MQWTFAQLCEECDGVLSNAQRDRAIERIVGYLTDSADWIVLDSSMPPLATWATTRPELAATVRPHLEHHARDDRKSVARRAAKALSRLQSPIETVGDQV